ncbi:MAG: hypothetical protein H6523_11290 [Mycolicibacterium sp.]|nr:hypothetical protein [Mycolicibacterium sp.]
MGGRPHKRKRKAPDFLQTDLPRYDATAFAEADLFYDQVVSVLGAPIDGWVPELVYRYTIFGPTGLNVNWAIMLYAYRAEEGVRGARRRVERIDICDSEVHTHRFRRSDDPDDDQGERSTVISLNSGDEATVSHQWDVQMMALSREWRERMRRWIDG